MAVLVLLGAVGCGQGVSSGEQQEDGIGNGVQDNDGGEDQENGGENEGN